MFFVTFRSHWYNILGPMYDQVLLTVLHEQERRLSECWILWLLLVPRVTRSDCQPSQVSGPPTSFKTSPRADYCPTTRAVNGPVNGVHSSAPKSSIRRFVITEKAPTRAFSWLNAATTAFTFKTLLRHYAKQTLTHGSRRKIGMLTQRL